MEGIPEADERLRKAIIEHARAYGFLEDDELVNEYALVVHLQSVVDDGSSRYLTLFHTGSIPDHVALGLFEMGRTLIAGFIQHG